VLGVPPRGTKDIAEVAIEVLNVPITADDKFVLPET
jgi:hypothetical protein